MSAPNNHTAEVGRTTGDPFEYLYKVPVAGGTLNLSRAGPHPDQADAVVLAIHGITANGMAWRAVARELARTTHVSLLAPDLRGRGENTDLPGPYGIAQHVGDMLAILDYFSVERAVLAGHSMGGFLAARVAAEHPERVASLVLVDGGIPVGEISDEAGAAANAITVGPALVRHALSFTSESAYLDFSRLHPAFLAAWNDDAATYFLHDLGGKPGARKYHINVDAVEADSEQMLLDRDNRNMLDRADVPVSILRAERGALDDENPLIPQTALDDFIAAHPRTHVDQVEDVNHYTLMLGEGPGPARVAAAIEAAVHSVMRG